MLKIAASLLLASSWLPAVELAPASISAASSMCTPAAARANLCGLDLAPGNAGDRAQVRGQLEQYTGGRSPAPSTGNPRATGNWAPPTPDTYTPPPDQTDGPIVCLDDSENVVGADCATDVPEPVEAEPAPVEVATPPEVVTITDIASFVPAAPSIATEPDGIGAKNMPLNTIATSSAQTLGGELFGFPVSVTFTPAGFRQDWGDETVTETVHGGASWATIGQAEFSPTDTSHSYAEKGTYTLTVTPLYTAVVDFGVWGTRTVEGVISGPAAARDIRIVEVHTALVDQDCLENPTGAGCS
ncbi:hypothetical protein E4U02_15095 [Microbacterium paludicola]|uniref:PKD domain-containing protein n=1 Tax=Microbacterium paludicola TaxID=300019 RepID=A0A4Y9FLI3_9MICO|nr:hypothetical protein [Microbacterium paludicola]MBF0817731.1 hypothetical protein [Microbacterium paludicola]TFU30065.1 hypothetical protein E4U02_15095 [Microbacterium paludicola]